MHNLYIRKENEDQAQIIANALATVPGVSVIHEDGLEANKIALDIFGYRLYLYSSAIFFKKEISYNSPRIDIGGTNKLHLYYEDNYVLILNENLTPRALIQKNENHLIFIKNRDVFHVGKNGKLKQIAIPFDFLKYTIFLRKKINDMLMLAFPALGVSNEATGSDELYVEKTSFHENIKLFFGHHNMQVGNTFQAQGADWVVFTSGDKGFFAVKKE